MKAIYAASALLFCTSLGFCQQPEKILFRMHPKAGNPTHVRINMHTEAVGKTGAIDLDFVLKEEFKEQTAKGYVWEMKIESADVEGTGEFSGADSSLTSQLVGHTERYVTSAKGQYVTGDAGSLRSFGGSILFPDKAVSVGETWEQMVAGRAGDQKMAYTFTQIIEDKGLRLAVVEARTKDDGPVRTQQPFVYWINLADGLIVKIDGEGETSRGSMSVKARMHFERTYDSDKPEPTPAEGTKKPPVSRQG